MPEIYISIPQREFWDIFCDMMDGVIEVIPLNERSDDRYDCIKNRVYT